MSYCTGKNIEKSRGKAMKMLVIEKKPVEVVVNRLECIEVQFGDGTKDG